MNNARRKQLLNLIPRIDELQSTISELQEALEAIRDEEQEYLDNIPENLQGSEKYGKSEQAIESLDSAAYSLENMYDEVSDILGNIDEAM